MTGELTIRTLRCDFVRNATFANKLVLQDSYRAEQDYWLMGLSFSSALFNRSILSTGCWVLVNSAQVLDFANAQAIRLLASQCLVRSSALGVDSFAHRSEWVQVGDGTPENPGFRLYSGQTIGLYAFASNLNTQRNFTTVALALMPADAVAPA